MLSLRERLAQLIMVGWREERPGTEASRRRLERLLARCPAGGILIFGHGSAMDMTRFIRSLPKPAGLRMLVSVDLEDGLGERCDEVPRLPNAMAVGASGDARLAFLHGRSVGLQARRVGIDIAFAPVSDVNTNPLNPIINIRSFGGDPKAVSRMAAAWTRGCQSAGVLACAKHFPGHGDTSKDSHLMLPTGKGELAPFRAAVRAGVGTVMTAHVIFPAFDRKRPATLSKAVLTGILRKRLGFRGLVVTDGFAMKGIASHYGEGRAAVMALNAGCDVILAPRDPGTLLDSMEAAYRRRELTDAVVDAAVARVEAARRRAGRIGPRSVGEAEAYVRAARRIVARRGVAWVRGKAAPPGKSTLWVVVDDDTRRSSAGELVDLLRRRHPKAKVLLLRDGKRLPAPPSGRFDAAVVAVFAKMIYNKGRIRVAPALLRAAKRAAGRKATAVLFGSPYVANDLPKSWPVLATFSDSPDSLEAGLDAVEGRLKVVGRVPVRLK